MTTVVAIAMMMAIIPWRAEVGSLSNLCMARSSGLATRRPSRGASAGGSFGSISPSSRAACLHCPS